MIKHGYHVPAPRTRYTGGSDWQRYCTRIGLKAAMLPPCMINDKSSTRPVSPASSISANPREDFSTLRGWDIGPALVPRERRTVGAWRGRRDLQVQVVLCCGPSGAPPSARFWAMDAVNPPQSTFHTSATGGPYTARWTSWKTWAPGPACRRADVRRGRKPPVGDAGLVSGLTQGYKYLTIATGAP